MLNPDEVKAMIEAGVEDATVTVRDMTGTGDHFEAVVQSPAFEGKTLVQQHQMVYAALGRAMAGPVHALKLRTMTPRKE